MMISLILIRRFLKNKNVQNIAVFVFCPYVIPKGKDQLQEIIENPDVTKIYLYHPLTSRQPAGEFIKK